MKRITGYLALGIVIIATACTPKTEETKKEIIVVPAPPVVIVKDPPAKNTTVTLDKNGVKVVTKKVDISVKKQ